MSSKTGDPLENAGRPDRAAACQSGELDGNAVYLYPAVDIALEFVPRWRVDRAGKGFGCERAVVGDKDTEAEAP